MKWLYFEAEYRFWRPNNGWYWEHAFATVIERNDQGQAVRVVGFHQDISKRKQAQIELMESEARLALALHVARLGHWRYDCATNGVEWSHDHDVLFGIPAHEFRGNLDAVQEIVHPHDRDHGMENMRKALEENVPFDNHYRVIHPDGAIRYLHSYGHVFRDQSGVPIEVFGVTRDITAEKESEATIIAARDAAEAANKAKSEFLANMSHELL